MQILNKFQRTRASRQPPPSPKECHLLAAPLEIRFMVYERIAEGSFLPHTHYQNYIGVLLSCKQICGEMQQESLRVAPAILDALQKGIAPDSIVKLGPSQPLNLASLNHLTIGIPSWALFNSMLQNRALGLLLPLLQLHLSSLTFGLEDLVDEMDVFTMEGNLTGRAAQKAYDAIEWAQEHVSDDEQDFYNLRTTYAPVVKFASKITCLVMPSICDGKHSPFHPGCLRKTQALPADTPCNVRKIVFRLKKLHDEVLSPSGTLPRDIYPGNSKLLRWTPDDDLAQLHKGGWTHSWYNEKGKVHFYSGRKPVMFVWTKREDQ